MNTEARTSSGSRRRPAGLTSRLKRGSRSSASWWTTPWPPSSETTGRSGMRCPRTTPGPALDKTRLGQLIDLITNIQVGDAEARSKDVLGRVYEYFLSQFASAEGKKGGEFYTPRCAVKLLVEMLEPYQGRVYDPCCGSSGMFVQSIEFIQCPHHWQWQRGQDAGRHFHLGPGVQLHHLAPGQDEPGASRDRGQYRPRRQLPQ